MEWKYDDLYSIVGYSQLLLRCFAIDCYVHVSKLEVKYKMQKEVNVHSIML